MLLSPINRGLTSVPQIDLALSFIPLNIFKLAVFYFVLRPASSFLRTRSAFTAMKLALPALSLAVALFSTSALGSTCGTKFHFCDPSEAPACECNGGHLVSVKLLSPEVQIKIVWRSITLCEPLSLDLQLWVPGWFLTFQWDGGLLYIYVRYWWLDFPDELSAGGRRIYPYP